ncbi:hypothetical protein V8E52_004105 [Russula decolorans]
MRNPVQGLRTEVLLLLFLHAYFALYNKINNSLCNLRFFFSFFFFDVFAGFSGIYCAIFWSNREPDANESKKRKGGSKTQTNGEKAGRRKWGPAAGAQVSAATQRTRTSDSGTDVCTTLSPRHDNVMQTPVVRV